MTVEFDEARAYRVLTKFGFDPEAYLNYHSDMQDRKLSALLRHLNFFGIAEKRLLLFDDPIMRLTQFAHEFSDSDLDDLLMLVRNSLIFACLKISEKRPDQADTVRDLSARLGLHAPEFKGDGQTTYAAWSEIREMN